MSKASGGDGILAELFKILKDDAVKMLYSICQLIWKTQQWSQDWERSVFIPIPKKVNAKECSNYCTIALISHASKIMLKILQAGLQQYMKRELPDVQSGFRIVNKAQVDVFLEYPCFSYDPMDYGNLISGSSAFSKSTLYIWKFSLHVLLKSSLENVEHYFVRV